MADYSGKARDDRPVQLRMRGFESFDLIGCIEMERPGI